MVNTETKTYKCPGCETEYTSNQLRGLKTEVESEIGFGGVYRYTLCRHCGERVTEFCLVAPL